MADGRKNNGAKKGENRGAGRKSKDEENRIRGLSIGALTEVFGSEEEAMKSLAEQAKESFPHFKLLLEYAYGKPVQTIDQNTTFNGVIDMSEWK